MVEAIGEFARKYSIALTAVRGLYGHDADGAKQIVDGVVEGIMQDFLPDACDISSTMTARILEEQENDVSNGYETIG